MFHQTLASLASLGLLAFYPNVQLSPLESSSVQDTPYTWTFSSLPSQDLYDSNPNQIYQSKALTETNSQNSPQTTSYQFNQLSNGYPSNEAIYNPVYMSQSSPSTTIDQDDLNDDDDLNENSDNLNQNLINSSAPTKATLINGTILQDNSSTNPTYPPITNDFSQSSNLSTPNEQIDSLNDPLNNSTTSKSDQPIKHTRKHKHSNSKKPTNNQSRQLSNNNPSISTIQTSQSSSPTNLVAGKQQDPDFGFVNHNNVDGKLRKLNLVTDSSGNIVTNANQVIS